MKFVLMMEANNKAHGVLNHGDTKCVGRICEHNTFCSSL